MHFHYTREEFFRKIFGRSIILQCSGTGLPEGLCSRTSRNRGHATVCVAIVTYNSGRYIRRCLEAVLPQEGVDLEVMVVDNASTDDTRAILRRFRGRIRTILSDRNLGFAEAQNRAIRCHRRRVGADPEPRRAAAARISSALWWMPVRPIPAPARSAASCSPSARASSRSPEPRIDSTGIYLHPRHAPFRPRLARARRRASSTAWSTSSAPAPPPRFTAAR